MPETLNRAQPEFAFGVRLLLALSKLTDRERHVVMRLHYHGLTRAQVADELGVGRERVRQLEDHGLAKLRRLLGPYHEMAA